MSLSPISSHGSVDWDTDPAAAFQLNDRVVIVDCFFEKRKGHISKMPNPDDWIDWRDKWEEACKGDGYDDLPRTPLVDHFWVKLTPLREDEKTQNRVWNTTVEVTFLQPENLEHANSTNPTALSPG